ncbi:MAG TPA: 2-amino-4-hydroxy-6-hydroxymethyldihydropteridine diphosphokinase [Bryobacteraceae bacterium]|nr:2-amino-4-hydroxy-6-hydroxymethyldihydropteridine diphosphokinase [Bryobacteraceae bacterium]
MAMKTVYLGLGSNVGDRETHLQRAVEKLQASGLRVLRISPLYETEPVGYTPQRWFLNLVLEAETDLFPIQLLARVSRIERALGRIRTVVNGPRTIDIDILLYGQTVVQTVGLEIPHPLMAERRFVLAPLSDLAPGLRLPRTQRTVRELLEALTGQEVRRVGAAQQWLTREIPTR